jgi:hypothetical protein
MIILEYNMIYIMLKYICKLITQITQTKYTYIFNKYKENKKILIILNINHIQTDILL